MGLFGSSEKKESDDSLIIDADKDSIGIKCKNRILVLKGEKIDKLSLEDCKMDNTNGKGFIKVKRINII